MAADDSACPRHYHCAANVTELDLVCTLRYRGESYVLQALLWLRRLVAVCLKRIVVIRVDLVLPQGMRRCRLLLAAALLKPLVMLPGQQLRRVALVAQRRQRLVIVIRVICEVDKGE